MTGGELGIGALLAIAIVPLVSFIKAEHWSDRVKFMLSAAVCIVAAAVQTLVSSGHFTQFVAYAGMIVASAQAFFHMYFAGTAAEQKLAGIKTVA